MVKGFFSILTMMLMVGPLAQADMDYAVEVGVRQQSADVEGASADSQMGMQFGVTANVPVSGAVNFHTGMLYTQRNILVKTPGGDSKVEMSYLDIPVTLMYKFEEYVGVYAGVAVALNLDKKAEHGTVEDVKSPLMPLLLGVSFKFAPNFGANLYYENASGEAAKFLKDYRAVGVNLMVTFD